MSGIFLQFILMIFFSTKFLIQKCWNRFKIKTASKETHLLILPSFLLTLAVILPTVALLAIFWIYKQIVNIALKIKLGKEYICMVTGVNVVTCLREGKETSTVSLLIITTSNETGQNFYDSIKNRIKEAIADPQYAQLFSIREKYMDYMYLRAVEFQPEEIVKRFDARNEEELMAFINKHNVSDLPKGNLGNIDVALSSEILEGRAGYAMMVRVHHCLTDGLAFYNIIGKLFCKSGPVKDVYANDLSKRVQTTSETNHRNILKDNLTILLPSTLPLDVFEDASEEESNIILSYVFEPEVNLVPVIKKIKKRIPNLAFNAIVLSAFSASVAEYYLKKCKPNEIPEYISAAMPFLLNRDRFQKAYGSERCENFGNDFTIALYTLPVIPKNKLDSPIDDYIVDRLLCVKNEFLRIAKSPELITNYVLMKTLLEVVPFSIVQTLFCYGSSTASVSCIPGGPKLHLFQGDEMSDVVFFSPKQKFASIAFCALTYDNRLQMSLKGNETRISEPAVLESILKGAFRFLDVIDRKTEMMFGN